MIWQNWLNAVITEGGVTGIYFSLQNLLGISPELYKKSWNRGKRNLSLLPTASAITISSTSAAMPVIENDLSLYKDYDVKTVTGPLSSKAFPIPEGRKIPHNRPALGGFGNLDSELLYKGSKEEIQAETKRILAEAGRQGVLLGADCTVPRDIDWKHFEWVREAAR